QAARGRVRALVVPAAGSWGEGGAPAATVPPAPPRTVASDVVRSVADVLRSGEPVALLFGGRACRERGLRAVSRIAQATGAKPFAETFPARMERGAGLPNIERLGYLAEDRKSGV